ncbi:hypothetical protein BD413DRAFT_210164 [Trametes elegans]|nr:hypothetical protein BD413DRAFT_210164 [Trametes elegans]
MSLPTAVHSALRRFATLIGMPPVTSTPGFFADTAACILRPRVYYDSESAIIRLAQQGCTVVLLAPYSSETLTFLRATLSEAPLRHAHVCPMTVSMHSQTPHLEFLPAFRAWCKAALGLPDLTAGKILIATTGMGRLVNSASLQQQPTALMCAPGNIESTVRYVVDKWELHNPAASVSIDGLATLCDVVHGANQEARLAV